MTDADLSTLLFCSVRYALGRMTYIVSDVCRIVREQHASLAEQDRRNIIRGIWTAIGEGRAGMQTDIDQWKALIAALTTSPRATTEEGK